MKSPSVRAEANDYRTQVQVGEALKASGLAREEAFVTTKCPGAIGFNATLQCSWDVWGQDGGEPTNMGRWWEEPCFGEIIWDTTKLETEDRVSG